MTNKIVLGGLVRDVVNIWPEKLDSRLGGGGAHL